MELLYIFFVLLTLHYVYFVGSIYFGLINLTKLKSLITPQKESVPKFISIVIPFRNEADIILQNLRSIEQLNYPIDQFEVIYIDDHSDDNSVELLNKNKHKENTRVVQAPGDSNNKASKKRAVEYGISLAKGEIIFASDADCTYNPDWITVMLKYMTKETGFVAGPVDFETSNTIFGHMQKFEHASLILTGAGLIGIRNPIICSGANIAFRKKVFYEVDGYSGYSNLASGDDSFLMTKVFYDSRLKVGFCYDNSAMVKTRANKNLGEFINQRKRWAGKAFFYKKKIILLQVVMLALFLISLPVALILGLVLKPLFLYFFLTGFLVKSVMDYLAMNTGTKTLYDRKIMRWFWITEVLHIPYTFVTVLLGSVGRFTWKGRDLKK